MSELLDYTSGKPVLKIEHRTSLSQQLGVNLTTSQKGLEADKAHYLLLFMANQLAPNDKGSDNVALPQQRSYAVQGGARSVVGTLANDSNLRELRIALIRTIGGSSVHQAEQAVADMETKALQWAAGLGDEKAKKILGQGKGGGS